MGNRLGGSVHGLIVRDDVGINKTRFKGLLWAFYAWVLSFATA